jgi:hypothetical protein
VVLVSGLTETAGARLNALRRFDPLLDAWVRQGDLCEAEADLVLLAAEATEQRAPLRLALPGGSSALAAAMVLQLAVRTVLQPGRYPTGAILLAAGARERAAAASLDANGELIAGALSAVRLRADGLVQSLGGARVTPLGAEHRLVFASPRCRWPKLEEAVGVAVLDRHALGTAYDEAHDWALRSAAVVHVVADLDPSMMPSSFEVDWPLIAESPERWGRTTSWPIGADITLEVAAHDPVGLVEARARIAGAAGSIRPWPAQLNLAAGLSRALATVAAPLGTYDAHTVGTIATSFAERAADLAEAGPAALPVEWRSFAETDWAPIKRGLLDAADELEVHNPKAELVGLAVEAILAGGDDVDIWTDTGVHARALQTHLLTAGFGVSPADFEFGRLRVRPLGEAHSAGARHAVSLLTALPQAWHLPAVLAGAVGGPLTVVAYPFEADRAARYFGWQLNAGRVERHKERSLVIGRALGRGVAEDAAPEPIHLQLMRRDRGDAVSSVAEYGEDAAEFAALATDDWLALNVQRRERDVAAGTQPIAAIGYLVDPGPAVFLVGAHGVVDRIVAGRLRPTPAEGLTPGMRVLTSNATGGVFDSIRPHLDRIYGLGTRFWLDQWDEALRAAVAATGSPAALAAELARRGASIGAAAVASWPSPYRMGPRDPANVARVADIADHAVARHNHQRVHAVMRGVRIEHGRLGRQLAIAMRRHLDGDIDAFDVVEERLGIDIEALLGDPTTYTVRERLATGTAAAHALGRVHPIVAAQQLFHPQETS